MLTLRDYQDSSLNKLRHGFLSSRAQMLYAPTGAGKTETAIALLTAAADKGNRVAMVMDRRVLCEQTSARLEKYGIDHGVMMQGHWRYRTEKLIQICSAQTLEARGDFPGLKLLIVDEAHCTRKSVANFIKNYPHVKVIGLSASPFTKGLGSIYNSVINAITTRELVDSGMLAPLRVFLAKEIDMAGAKKVAGEWSQKDATDRGIKITGDIVSEWVKKTHEIFGAPKKTIVFCAGVAHGEDLSRQFAAAGYNFVSISYKDDDEFKQEAIKEFSKPDSDIHGLIATDILTKGFDQADVMIGISARPFTKSFSSHVQQLGRVMRPHADKSAAIWLDHCIASGQRVLTHRGLIAIDMILLSDRIWDGHEFVTHKGVISRGKRPVITYAGLTATADHLVKTADESWCSLGYCADKQKAIITTGVGRTALRECDDYLTGCGVVGGKTKALHSCALRVRNLWVSLNNLIVKFTGRSDKRLQAVQSTKACSGMAERKNCRNDAAMQESEEFWVRKLWWKGNRVQIRFSDFLRSLDSRELGLLAEAQGYGARQDRQQRELRAGEYPLGTKESKPKQQKKHEMGCADAQVQIGTSRDSICGRIIARIFSKGHDVRRDRGEIPQAFQEAEREVWDIRDCGQRNSFTCEGLLVHNSGNYLRFRDQWESLYSEGVSELDDGAEKPKPEPTEKEKDRAKCPKCGALWPGNSDVCAHCGMVRIRRNDVVAVAGEMLELTGQVVKKEKFTGEYKEAFFQGLLGYAKAKGYKDGWAFHAYIDKFGVQPSWKKQVAIPNPEVIGWITHRNIKNAKRRAA